MVLRKSALLSVACLVMLLGPVQADDHPRRDGFFFGMTLEDANELLEGNTQYEVLYRIDTASTADIFCTYQEKTQYLAHFLRGECCSVEKRAIVAAEAQQQMFGAYSKTLGDSYEAANSADGKTHYAHWTYKDRELELTALRRSDGRFLLIHEEYDPRLAGEARMLQARELPDSPAGEIAAGRQRLTAE